MSRDEKMEKKTCPTCQVQVAVLITNVQNGQQFCHQCSAVVCPTFLPNFVLTKEDVKWLREIGMDPEVSKIEEHIRCKRPSGTERASFRTREEAEVFAADPANPGYHEDIPSLCARCDLYHLNRPEWLDPVLTHKDGALLESMGIDTPVKVSGDLRCAQCQVVFRTGIDFLILPDGKTVCGVDCAAR
jgi:hypothetical protein